MFRILILVLFISYATPFFGQDQQVSIQYDNQEIKVGKPFSIRLKIRNSEEWKVSDFPEINGMIKTGVSISHSRGPKNEIVHTVSQNYEIKEAKPIYVPSFKIIVNNIEYSFPSYSKGLNVEQVEEKGSPFIVEINEAESNSLLLLSVSKKEVYVGEGVRVMLGFYISDNDPTPWEFPSNLGIQVEEIAKTLKSKDCLVSRLNFNSISNTLKKINGINYTDYRLFEAVFYPLRSGEIIIPSAELTMSKGENQTQKFYSKRTIIKVKDLPDHPLKLEVAVGDYKLDENIVSTAINTGKTFDYSIKISGKGSFSQISTIEIKNSPRLDFFPPKTIDNLTPGLEYGSKEFKYKVFPKDSGQVKFKDYFSWIYFNTSTEKYDTLSPRVVINVSGPSFAPIDTHENDVYEDIQNLSTTGTWINFKEKFKLLANIIVCLMMALLIYIYIRKRT